ncbi:predicted protein [Chaetoceros tenuissimus]|nr:predicted protein [Chaetoceros tenuissimus]
MEKETEIPRASDESIMSFEDSSRAKYFPESSNLTTGTNMATAEDEIRLKSNSSAVIDLDTGGRMFTKENESKETKDLDFSSEQNARVIDLGIPKDEWENKPTGPLHSNGEGTERTDLESYAQPPTYWKLATVFKRNLKNQYISNIANVVGRLASYSILSILIGWIFFQVGEGANSASDGLTFTEADLLIRTNIFVLNVSYLLPFSSIPVFVGDKRFFVAESALGLYSPWMYGLSQGHP